LAPITPGLRDVGVEMNARSGGGELARHGPKSHPTSGSPARPHRRRQVGAGQRPQFQWFNPSYVFGIGLHGAGWDFAGNTPFAYPSVIFGTNREISWGATAGPMNVVDMYQETLDPANARQYLYDGQWRDMQVRTVSIPVKGVAGRVLRRAHDGARLCHLGRCGQQPSPTAKKRSWTGYEVSSLIAWVKLARAKNFDEFSALAAQFAISINWYYADKKGNIGYISARSPAGPSGQPGHPHARSRRRVDGVEGHPAADGQPGDLQPRPGLHRQLEQPGRAGIQQRLRQLVGGRPRDQEILAAFTGPGAATAYTSQQMWELNERFSFADLNLRYLAPVLTRAVAGLPADDPVRRDVELLTTMVGRDPRPQR
jgi:penicillin amidase